MESTGNTVPADRNFKIDLWRAFYLGVRATIVSRNEQVTSDAVHLVLQRLDAVARGDETIHDPASETTLGKVADEAHISRMQAVMRSDRQLANEISEGFHFLAGQK